MARVDFPDSPSNGATITANGITYIYDAAKGVWRDNATAGIASDNPPAILLKVKCGLILQKPHYIFIIMMDRLLNG